MLYLSYSAGRTVKSRLDSSAVDTPSKATGSAEIRGFAMPNASGINWDKRRSQVSLGPIAADVVGAQGTSARAKCGLMLCGKKGLYSITSSARARRVGAIVTPSALAVLRLMAS